MFDHMADITNNFSGADITELCQRAAKSAIRDAITAEEEYRRKHTPKDGNPDDVDMSEMPDAVPTIQRKHFDDAWKTARTSISTADLHKFE